jgi:hypothetical protein
MTAQEKAKMIEYMISKKSQIETFRDSKVSQLAGLQQGITFIVQTVIEHPSDEAKIRLADYYIELRKVDNEVERYNSEIKDLTRNIRFLRK